MTRAAEEGIPSSIAVVDESGVLKAFERMDGAVLASVDASIDKAYSALALRSETQAFFERMEEYPQLMAGIPAMPRMTILGGGLPIRVEGEVVGGLGVGGGHFTDDIEIARAGISRFEELQVEGEER